MNVAVIPARGGSKRIPRKNIRDFAGKPMIAHPITCALQSGLFRRVIVSTDDDEIASMARSFGAEVPFIRPESLSDDYAGTTEVIAHAAEFLLDRGEQVSAICCLYATAPFVRREDLATGLDILTRGQWSYVFSATSFASPIQRSFMADADGGIRMMFPEHFGSRSQDLPEAMHDAGQFYWGRTQAWLDRIRIFDTTSTIVALPRWRVQDIDTVDDWRRAELLWQQLQSDGSGR